MVLLQQHQLPGAHRSGLVELDVVVALVQPLGIDDLTAAIAGDLPDADAMLGLMGQDKKVVQGELRFILARSIGDAFVTGDVPREAVKSVLQDALALR